MSRVTELGYTALAAKEGGSYWIPLEEYERAVLAWTSGEAFFVTVDLYGGLRTIKLGTIESIGEWPPGALAVLAREAEAERRDDAIRG